MLSFKTKFHLLRESCLAESTTEFSARGKSVVRCEHCQIYFPQEEAVSRAGHLYCCAAHAEQARRPT